MLLFYWWLWSIRYKFVVSSILLSALYRITFLYNVTFETEIIFLWLGCPENQSTILKHNNAVVSSDILDGKMMDDQTQKEQLQPQVLKNEGKSEHSTPLPSNPMDNHFPDLFHEELAKSEYNCDIV